jgi:hypothetical protein
LKIGGFIIKKLYFWIMKVLFKILALLNKWLLPSLTKRGVDLAKANKFQMALFGWRLYVTMKALD